MLDFLEALEALCYFGAFWAFVLSGRARAAVLKDWRGRRLGGKLMGVVEGSIAAVVGLGPFVLVGWLLAS